MLINSLISRLMQLWSPKDQPISLFVNNTGHSLPTSPSYFINRKITALIAIIQSAAMDLMTKSLTRRQKNSFSFLVWSPKKRI